MTRVLRRMARTAAVSAVVTVTATLVPVTSASAEPSVQSQLAAVRQATAPYHNVEHATSDGFVPLLSCFDDPVLGGMGQHYVVPSRLDGRVNLTEPQALVYEVDGDRLQLVAVEYIVPGPADMTPPRLLGRNYTYLADLGVWKLHAWIWRPNPAGMFADYNPNVAACPAP